MSDTTHQRREFCDASAPRKEILLIFQNTELSPAEQNRRIQNLLFPKLDPPTIVKSVDVSPPTIPECRHYSRGCRIKSPCCQGKVFGCSTCHNEYWESQPERHTLRASSIREIECKQCGHSQPFQAQCENCGNLFGSYFCSPCRLIDNGSSSKLFHCEKCGFCRRGHPGRTYRHCDKCESCMDESVFGGHKCIAQAFKSQCPICTEVLFTSRSSMCQLPCGHAIHTQCLEQYLCKQEHHRCPVCLKTCVDESTARARWEQRASEIADFPMPDGDIMTAWILCYDCSTKGQVNFHYFGLQCLNCNSFNTTRIDPDEPESCLIL